MRLSAKILGQEFNFSTGRTKANAGRMQGSTGKGFDVTQSSRTRRRLNLIAGLVASADSHLDSRTLGQLREICRMLDRRSPLCSGLLDTAANNIIGNNFDFIPNAGDKKLNKKAKAYITTKMEARFCDATGVRDFEDLAKTTLRALWTDGDNLWVKRPDGSALLFEADQIESPSARDKNIVLGVEMDNINRHIAYHVKQRTDKKSAKVVTANAIMPAYRKRINQTRGLPFMAASLGYFTRFNSYLDFESLAAEANSMQGFKITREKPSEDEDNFGGIEDNEDTSTNGTFEKLQKMEALSVYDLGVGEDIGMFGSERPGSNFENYVIVCCRIIGVSVGMPLELMLKDFSRTNYSSARASLGEARRAFRGWQKTLQKALCLPWYRWQIARGIASGELPAKPELFRTRCQWPAWEYIDPKKAAEGNAIARSIATKSISQCIRETGGEPDEVFQEIADDNKKLTELGIVLPATTLQVIAGGQDPDEKEDSNKKEDE